MVWFGRVLVLFAAVALVAGCTPSHSTPSSHAASPKHSPWPHHGLMAVVATNDAGLVVTFNPTTGNVMAATSCHGLPLRCLRCQYSEVRTLRSAAVVTSRKEVVRASISSDYVGTSVYECLQKLAADTLLCRVIGPSQTGGATTGVVPARGLLAALTVAPDRAHATLKTVAERPSSEDWASAGLTSPDGATALVTTDNGWYRVRINSSAKPLHAFNALGDGYTPESVMYWR